MRLTSRDQWGARPPRSASTMRLPAPDVWLHHTAGNEPDGPEGIRRVQNFHMDSRGYHDIAYSFVVDRQGAVYVGRGAGIAGAHTRGHNSTSHAICVLGNYDRDTVPTAVVEAVAGLLRHGHRQGWWSVAELTGGHRDVGSTSCPGNNLYRAIDDINRRARSAEGRTVTAKRIGGGDRHETAAMLARTKWQGHTGGLAFLLATGSPDGDAVANVADMGPILTVEQNRLPQATAAELGRFKPDQVVAIGLEAAISDAVLEQARKAAR